MSTGITHDPGWISQEHRLTLLEVRVKSYERVMNEKVLRDLDRRLIRMREDMAASEVRSSQALVRLHNLVESHIAQPVPPPEISKWWRWLDWRRKEEK